jgi:hypothetical protein
MEIVKEFIVVGKNNDLAKVLLLEDGSYIITKRMGGEFYRITEQEFLSMKNKMDKNKNFENNGSCQC